MYLLFVDESGTPPKPDRPERAYFVIAGLVIPEDRWIGIRDKLEGLKRSYQFHGEVKWRFFAPSNADAANPMLVWNQELRNEFRDRVFGIITETKSCRIIACVSEAPTAYGLGNVNTQDDLYLRTYKPVTERFQYFLQDITSTSGRDSLGMIIADHRGRGDDDQLRHQHERLLGGAANYTSSYANLVEGLFFSPSHMSVGIQFADMIAGAVWRAQSHNDLTWFNKLRKSFRSSPTGKIDGFGICRFPKAGWQGDILD